MPGLSVSANVITVDGFVIDSSSGVSCGAGTLNLRRSRVLKSSGIGVKISNCKIVMDRVLINGGNGDSAMTITGNSHYDVSNSFITSNSSGVSNTIVIADGSMGTFRFNTVAGNQSSTSPLSRMSSAMPTTMRRRP